MAGLFGYEESRHLAFLGLDNLRLDNQLPLPSSGRRFSVGRPSSPVLSSVPFLSVDEVRLKLGFLPSFWSFNLCLFSMAASLALTSSNYDPVTIYSGLAGSILAISLCEASIRS